MENSLKIAFSTCPNDIFVFYAWTHNLLQKSPKLNITYADIDITNKLITEKFFDILKISCAALPKALENGYKLLPCGGALSNKGPLILTHKSNNEFKIKDIVGKTVAIPSLDSTAFKLFQLLLLENNITSNMYKLKVIPFQNILLKLQQKEVDMGLVIHEARFIYKLYDLKMLKDLGKWWFTKTNLPLPLGVIVAKKEHNTKLLKHCIQESYKYALKNKEEVYNYALTLAQEKNIEIIKKHIKLYTNKFTFNIGRKGKKAIKTFLKESNKLRK